MSPWMPAMAAGPQDRHGAGTAPAGTFEEDLARQEAIFGELAGGLLARHPDRFMAVCGGDAFVGGDDGDAISGAQAAHPAPRAAAPQAADVQARLPPHAPQLICLARTA